MIGDRFRFAIGGVGCVVGVVFLWRRQAGVIAGRKGVAACRIRLEGLALVMFACASLGREVAVIVARLGGRVVPVFFS